MKDTVKSFMKTKKKIEKKATSPTKHTKFNALPCYGEDKAVKCLIKAITTISPPKQTKKKPKQLNNKKYVNGYKNIYKYIWELGRLKLCRQEGWNRGETQAL